MDESCWYCHGEGGFHDCGEDCCACIDKDEITEDCPECGGTGWLPDEDDEADDRALCDDADREMGLPEGFDWGNK